MERRGETGMSPESLFYLPRDGEIQINSCQSGGPQGEGLWRRGRMRLRVGWKGEIWRRSDGGWGWRGQGLTDGVSINREASSTGSSQQLLG